MLIHKILITLFPWIIVTSFLIFFNPPALIALFAGVCLISSLLLLIYFLMYTSNCPQHPKKIEYYIPYVGLLEMRKMKRLGPCSYRTECSLLDKVVLYLVIGLLVSFVWRIVIR